MQILPTIHRSFPLKKWIRLFPLIAFTILFFIQYLSGITFGMIIPFALGEPESQEWNTTWGGSGNDYGYGVAVAGDDVYVSGSTDSYGAGSDDAILIKYDSNGTQLWNSTWGGTGYDTGEGVARAAGTWSPSPSPQTTPRPHPS
jgi:hypothetical protein